MNKLLSRSKTRFNFACFDISKHESISFPFLSQPGKKKRGSFGRFFLPAGASFSMKGKGKEGRREKSGKEESE